MHKENDDDLRGTKEDQEKAHVRVGYGQIMEKLILKKLSWRALKVYLAIKAHEDYTTHLAFPTFNTIAAYTGITRGSDIKNAVLELVDHKLVSITKRRPVNPNGDKYGNPRFFYEFLYEKE